ncbi:hypothetical protein L8C07_05475 [Paenibacillus sp. CMAA1739]|uniref:hypothetical protein n=1 Tax=Paenibacillus ottowii TaxID=2315729 RepID=UPI002DB7419F|nr:hypothetical protein [Paenibacillus sp. CMAA1739]MEC4565388.1 hypothetical protein [Paenibacillus sp. CMAA1739]
MLMVTQTTFNNANVKTSIMDLDGRTYIVHLHSIGGFTCYLEDFETRKRSISKRCDTVEEAIEDAWNKIIKE